QVSYIIPDIGSPGMNVYVEFIGPFNVDDTTASKGNFGTDSLYLNNPGDNIRIECVNPADTSKVIIGPLVVSWDGRMISTQIFIHPSVAPNSWDWSALNPQYVIPLQVLKKGTPSNPQNFYIVQPFTFGDQSGNAQRVLGQGTLGKRSPRGAMLVDSMILANDIYTVSLIDCDLVTPGNQAYLSFILLSKGKIQGGINTEISADGDISKNGHGGDGGPGGGGGGGRFYDRTLGSSTLGDNGGSGFVSGGKGGANNSGLPLTNNAYCSIGSSSGSNGQSLNLVDPPIDQAYESAGGGTGHPFGQSGTPCGNGNGCTVPGEYGGGSGYQQKQSGGGGGFGTDGVGFNIPIIGSTGGRMHGNIMVVPIAGGSGGASGNPQGMDTYSGSGGGGGGAIRVFAPAINNLILTANGGNGGTGVSSNAHGGGGSGGFTDISVKIAINSAKDSVYGGASPANYNGGSGRIRNDYPVRNFVTNLPATATFFRGPTTDTSSLVKRQFTLTGSRNQLQNIKVYIKPESGQWQEFTGVIPSGNNWQIPLNLIGKDSLYFLAAIQDVTNPSGDISHHNIDPQFVFSQAAANIIKILKLPKIDGDTLITFRITDCPGATHLDSATIRNDGDWQLILNMNSASFSQANKGFSLVSPKVQTTVLPLDSVKINVRYNYQTGQRGIITDTLLIPHNDMQSPNQPWRIVFEAIIDTLDISIYDITHIKHIDTLDFGKMCVANSKDTSVTVMNFSSVDINLNIPASTKPIIFKSSINGSSLIPVTQSKDLNLSFTPDNVGLFTGMIYISITECPAFEDSIFVTGVGVHAQMDYLNVRNDTLDIGKVCVGSTKDTTFIIRNLSISPVTLDDTQVLDNVNFATKIIGSKILSENSGTTTNQVTFIPSSEGKFVTKLYFSTKDCGGDTDSIYVTGEGVKSQLQFTGSAVFPDTKVGAKDTISVKLINNGKGSVYITSIPVLSPPFSIINYSPPVPGIFAQGDSIIFDIEFAPQSEGTDSTILIVFSIPQNNACADSAQIFVKGTGVKSHVELSKYALDFGLIGTCQTKSDTVIVRNKGTGPINVNSKANITGNDPNYFLVISEPPSVPYSLKPGDSSMYIIEFVPLGSHDGTKNAIFELNTDDPVDSVISVPLTGRNEGLNVTFNQNINFGGVPVGDTSKRTITLTNNGTLPQHVKAVISSNPDITVLPQTTTIPGNGGTQDFVIQLIFSKTGNYSDSITFIFDTPCPDSVLVQVQGVGLQGKIATNSLDYGILAPCMDSTETATLTNTGFIPVIILTNPSISGTDAGLFSIIDTNTYPDTLQSGETYKVDIKFNPANSSDGVKQAQLVLSVSINHDINNVLIDLKGERRTGLLSIPNLLSFGNVTVNSSLQKTVTLKNSGMQPISLRSILPFQNGKVFKTIPYPVPSITLNPGDSITLIV
ncbi:MAG: choice-of-anchor D domain-containing protein, partial [FCB group bacterium]